MPAKKETTKATTAKRVDEKNTPPTKALNPQKEIGGPKGKEPTRFGDWERGGKCVDF